MNIVEEVAEAIAEIPGRPSSMEIARIAIEAYQKALWTPNFATRTVLPEFRRRRTQQVTACIMGVVSKYLCDHGDRQGARDASSELFETFYEAGAEIITDADRTAAGLPPRDQYGLTVAELQLIEQRRLDVMRAPIFVPSVLK